MKSLYPADFLDFRKWLTPYLNPMFDVTTSNSFRFRMVEDKVVYESRPNSQSTTWESVGPLLKSIPPGAPCLLKMDTTPLQKFSKKN